MNTDRNSKLCYDNLQDENWIKQRRLFYNTQTNICMSTKRINLQNRWKILRNLWRLKFWRKTSIIVWDFGSMTRRKNIGRNRLSLESWIWKRNCRECFTIKARLLCAWSGIHTIVCWLQDPTTSSEEFTKSGFLRNFRCQRKQKNGQFVLCNTVFKKVWFKFRTLENRWARKVWLRL